ncbi:MAG: hypothetical protein AB7P20_18250 [Rhizobiaceae bacterium]
MWRNLLRAIVLAVVVTAGGKASAWLLYPDNDQPERIIVEIERPFGEFVPFSALPPPYNTALQEHQGPDALSYRWRYDPHDPRPQGMAYLRVDAAGDGVVIFDFAVERLLPGECFGAAVVLVDRSGRALYSFYARTEPPSDNSDARTGQLARLKLSRQPDWWQGIDGMTLLFMRYYPIQGLDDEQVWAAMRKAVHRITKGQGEEQQALARP